MCQKKVNVNTRTLSIRKHRLYGRLSEVCDGSGRLFLRPRNMRSTSANTIMYNNQPVFSSHNVNTVNEVISLLDVSCTLHIEPLHTLCDSYRLLSADTKRVQMKFFFIPWWATAPFNAPIVRAKSCRDMLAIPSSSNSTRAQALRDTLVDVRKATEKDEFLSGEIDDALRELDQGSTPHAPFDMSDYVIAAIIDAIALTKHESLFDRVWMLLTHRRIGADLRFNQAIKLSSILEKAQQILCVKQQDKTALQSDLVQLSKINDVLNVFTMFH
jgi:hypothetical protein